MGTYSNRAWGPNISHSSAETRALSKFVGINERARNNASRHAARVEGIHGSKTTRARLAAVNTGKTRLADLNADRPLTGIKSPASHIASVMARRSSVSGPVRGYQSSGDLPANTPNFRLSASREIAETVPTDLTGHIATQQNRSKWISKLSEKAGAGYTFTVDPVVKGTFNVTARYKGKYQSNFSLPTLAGVFNDAGQYTGHMSAMKVARLGAGKGEISNVMDVIIDNFQPGMSSAAMQSNIAGAMAYTRWNPMAGSRGNRTAQPFTPIQGMAKSQYRINLNNEWASSSPFEVPPEKDMFGRFHQAKSYFEAMPENAGKKLYIDPTRETSLAEMRFSTFGASDIDPMGGLYKGGYKSLQRHRTIPLLVNSSMRKKTQYDTIDVGMGGIHGSSARDIMFHGRMMETSYMYGLRNLDLKTGARIGVNSPIPVMNVAHRLVLGSTAARMFQDKDQAIHATGFQGMLARGTRPNVLPGADHMGFGMGTSYHGFMTKTNLVGTASARTLAGSGPMASVGVVRSMGRADPGHAMESLLGTWQLAMLKRGDSRDTIMKTMRTAVGAGNVTSNQGRVIINKGLFETELGANFYDLSPTDQSTLKTAQASKQFQSMRGVLSRLSSASGIGYSDLESSGFIKRRGGLISEMYTLGGVAQREHDLYRPRAAMGLGLSTDQGLRVSATSIADMRNMGATEMASYLSGVRGNDVSGAHMQFRKQALGVLNPLTGGASPANVPGTTYTVDQLLGGKASQFASEYTDWMAKANAGKVYDPSGIQSNIRAFAEKNNLGALSSLFDQDTGGIMLDLEGSRTVAGATKTGEVYKGSLKHLPVASMLAGGGDDYYAARVGRLLAEGPTSDKALGSMLKSSIPLFAGGDKSFYHKMFSPKMGNTLSARMQHGYSLTSGMSPDDTIDDIVKTHLKKYGGKFDKGAVYAVADQSMMGRLSADLIKTHGNQGYIRGLAHRWPETGRAAGSVRFIFADDKRLSGDAGYMVKQGFGKYVLGDTDADILNAVMAGDKDLVLRSALQQMEDVQRKSNIMRNMTNMGKTSIAKEFQDSAKDMTYLFDALRTNDMGVEGELGNVHSIMAKATAVKQLAGTFAAQSTKTTTPLVDPLVKRRLAGWTLARDKGLISMSAQDQLLARDLIPALSEAAISKHDGTDTLEMIQNINNELKLESVKKDIRNGTMSPGLRGKYENLFSDAMDVMHTQKTAGVFASGLDVGSELYGKMDDFSAESKDYKKFFQSSRGSALIDELAKGDLLAEEAHTRLSGMVGPDKKIFDGDLTKLRGTPFSSMPMDDTGISREMAELMGFDVVQKGAYTPGVSDMAGKAAASVTAAEAATATPIRSMGREIYQGAIDSIFNVAKKHPGKTAAVAAIAAAGTIVAGAHTVSNAVRSDHIAAQPNPIQMAPQTQYVMSPFDQVGFNMTMQGRGTPESLAFSQGVVNAMPGGADVRLMDSRTQMSDYSLGMMAEDKMNSIYSKSFV